MAPLKVFLETLAVCDKVIHYPPFVSFDNGGLEQNFEEDGGERFYSGFSRGSSEFCWCAYFPFVVCG